MACMAKRPGPPGQGSQREARQRHQQWPCHPDGATATGDQRNPAGRGGSSEREPHLARVQYYPCTGAAWALMANGDSGTGEAFIPVLKALQPIVEPLTVPSKKCAP